MPGFCVKLPIEGGRARVCQGLGARKTSLAASRSVKFFKLQDPGPSSRPESNGRASGLPPDHHSYFPVPDFNDPDGNTWVASGDHHGFARRRTQQSGRRDAERTFAGQSSIMASTNLRLRALLVGLVCRVHLSAPERKDAGRSKPKRANSTSKAPADCNAFPSFSPQVLFSFGAWVDLTLERIDDCDV